MSKKLFLLTSFVLVLGLALTNVARGVDPDLLGWWKFDEGSGTTAHDSSGKGNDGTLQGNPQWVAGKIGGALEFDGDGDYVDCGASLAFNINTNITVACWIKVRQLDKSWQAIVAQGDNSWRLHRSSSSNNIAWGTNGLSPKDLTGSVNVNDGQWHHVAGVYDGTQKRLYVDGNLDVSENSTGNINNSSYNVNIGENAEATGRYWDGLIDDVRVYNRALTQEEIQKVMMGIPPGAALTQALLMRRQMCHEMCPLAGRRENMLHWWTGTSFTLVITSTTSTTALAVSPRVPPAMLPPNALISARLTTGASMRSMPHQTIRYTKAKSGVLRPSYLLIPSRT